MENQRLQTIQRQIEDACARSGRDPQSVTLIGAAKTQSAQRVLTLARAGLAHIGENYVQEGVAKKREIEASAPDVSLQWHLIGTLQSNKARIAVENFDLIHSVDRLSLARELDKAARNLGKTQDVLLQVNIGDESTKAGCAPDEIFELAQRCADLPNLRICGLMALPPYEENPEDARPYFRRLRELNEKLPVLSTHKELSMGMTHDFSVAIEEGATMIRIGTGLFGARSE
jgi:PLP dependent protein